jgi:hypothetical protein
MSRNGSRRPREPHELVFSLTCIQLADIAARADRIAARVLEGFPHRLESTRIERSTGAKEQPRRRGQLPPAEPVQGGDGVRWKVTFTYRASDPT